MVLNPFQQAIILEPRFSAEEQLYQTHILNLLHNVQTITPQLLCELLFTQGNHVTKQEPASKGMYDYENCLCDSCKEYHCRNCL